jgi:CDP-diacylglycerol--serine O-phosphatidyltransferase
VSRFTRAASIAGPCVFTVGRLACALVVVVAAFDGTQQTANARMQDLAAFDRAAVAIAIAIVFDVLDGIVARLLGSASSFGVQLDSLADVAAFGVAPAALGFFWGVHPIRSGPSGASHELFVAAGWCAFTAFVACAVFRLARFNVDAAKPAVGHRYFVGLPVPAAAAVIGAVVHFAKQPLTDVRHGAAWLLLVAALSGLMVSRIQYDIVEPYPRALRTWQFRVPVAAALLWALWIHSEMTALVGVTACATSGPLRNVVRRLSAVDPRRPPA